MELAAIHPLGDLLQIVVCKIQQIEIYNNNNNNNNIYLLQLGCYQVAVVVLHV